MRLQLRSVKNIRILRGYQQNWREPDWLLTVREGIFIQTTEEKDKSACDIMAERDGEIIKMITRSGLPPEKGWGFM